MSEHRPALEHIQAYADHLRLEEKSAATVEKYLRDVRAFARWLEGREITKERTAAWKTHLVERGYAPASVNAMLSALNSLLDFLGFGDCRVKFLKVQRRMFRDDSRDLTRSDYNALTAERQDPHHPHPQQAVPQAAEIRQTAKNRFRRDLSHQKRDAPQPPSDLGGDEGAVQDGGGRGQQGLSPQPSPSVRRGLLPGQP